VLATKWAAFSFAHLVQRYIGFAPRLRQRIKIAHARLNYIKRINYLQWGDVVTKQLFRLAPHRIGIFSKRLAGHMGGP
jgi:hypothetical protein